MNRYTMEVIENRNSYYGDDTDYEVNPCESIYGDWVRWEDVRGIEEACDRLLETLDLWTVGTLNENSTYKIEGPSLIKLVKLIEDVKETIELRHNRL